MNIGVVIPELKKYGGAEKYLIECIKRWQYEHDLTIYAMAINEEMLHENGLYKYNCKEITSYIEGEHSLLLNGVLLPKIWEREIGAHDIYYTHLWPMHLLNLHPMVWCPQEPLRTLNDLRFEQPVVATRQEASRNIHTYPKSTYDSIDINLFSAYQSAVAAFDTTGRPDKILANSQYAAQYLSKVYSIEHVQVTYPGINKEDFFYQPPDENIILNVNQLWPHKRVNLLIEAMNYVENAQLYIVGSGPEEPVLQEQVKQLGLSDRVFFMHGVTNEELSILYARALCVAFASVREPFGIVALEAMAAGKPLVAVNEGGYCEVVDAEDAFLVDAIPQEFAEKINYLISHKNIATKMGLCGLDNVGKYSWDKCAELNFKALMETYQSYRQKKSVHTEKQALLVGVDYFVWYGKGFGASHWNDNMEYGAVGQRPRLGYYASDSGEIIRRHLRMLIDAGVDYIAANLHVDEQGFDVYQYNVIERILDIIEYDNMPIRLCIQMCPFTTNKKKIVDALNNVIKNFFKSEAYQIYRNKPLMYIFWTGSMDGDYEAIHEIRTVLKDATVIASSMRLYATVDESNKTFGLFDGWSLFSPLELSADEETRNALILSTYEQSAAGAENIKVFTVSPGYDDRLLENPKRMGNRVQYIPRNDGQTFEKMFGLINQLQEKPDMIKVSTFNEFHEATNIEPTLEIGDLYMEILKNNLKRLRGDE